MFAHGEAIVLGKIFIHESKIPTIVKVGQIVEATKLEKYESDDDIDCNYMATAINSLLWEYESNKYRRLTLWVTNSGLNYYHFSL